MLHFEFSKIGEYWRLFASGFNLRRHAGALDSIDTIEEFAITRSAFIAQKTLFGYVKTRMGTKYPEMFRDDNIIRSVNIAKMHVFVACLSDFSIWVVATAFTQTGIDDSQRRDIALRIFKNGLAQNTDTSVAEFSPDEAVGSFKARLAAVDWAGTAGTRDNFTQSPAAVVKWAPIADQLKKYDVEYVENSVKFAWNNIRRQFEKRLDAENLAKRLADTGTGAMLADGASG
ncbi:hypothetical protein L2D14_04305 [Thalassospiraceae bacterium LMO-JJ14]|nr:hypothetical protein L2D14_04305 [Thalassospiraceae bacterium LMO-JJ14]